MAVAAVVVARADVAVARLEAQDRRAVRVALVERARPVVAGRARTDERTIVGAPCRGKENGVSIAFAGNQAAIHAILGSPSGGGVVAVDELVELESNWPQPSLNMVQSTIEGTLYK